MRRYHRQHSRRQATYLCAHQKHGIRRLSCQHGGSLLMVSRKLVRLASSCPQESSTSRAKRNTYRQLSSSLALASCSRSARTAKLAIASTESKVVSSLPRRRRRRKQNLHRRRMLLTTTRMLTAMTTLSQTQRWLLTPRRTFPMRRWTIRTRATLSRRLKRQQTHYSRRLQISRL